MPLERRLFCLGPEAFLLGFLRKVVCRTWFLGGHVVVRRMVKLVTWRSVFDDEKYATILNYFALRHFDMIAEWRRSRSSEETS